MTLYSTSRYILIFAVSLALGGCGGLLPRSRYVTPDVSVPQQWQTSSVTGSSVATKEQWWRDFNNPTLSGLIERALKTNNDLAAATIKVKRAQLSAKLTNTNLTPTVSASANGSYLRDLNTRTETKSSGITGTASYEIDLWGKLASARDVSTWEAEATESDRRSTALSLIGTVATNYWTIAYLNERIATVEASIAYAEKILELVEVKYQAGSVSALDKVQAQQTIASQKAQQTQLRQQRTEARNALAILFDQAPENMLAELQRLPSGSLPHVDAGLPASLLAQRPDLQAAELRLKKYLASVDNTRASYYPSFTLTGSLGTSSTSLTDVIRNPFAALGVGLTLPFIQWNTMKLNVEIAKTDYEEAVVNFRQTLYSALSDVENALSARINYAEEVRQTEESLVLARKAEEIAEIRYRSGATALQSWLDAQESRRDAERALALARLGQLKNCMTLYQALGGTMKL
ncbi:efflux transporter outer membrane subunit [Geobacter sp. SVR]|uniref:efflux transporter outer membrane subunit n=1 Tax=Geobacter sp. SVR TaxID=2495594 RepID=UPI00143F01E5|nr:efflux transporter outer membrane subunit [Geobacter sp. SVR]BCS54174.1 outer membrane efflux protein [Geobacter sp. SVR]GCF85967.1 outer membrane efflux protein [Geobacter sp. SVR]